MIETYKKLLAEFVALPSVSTDPIYAPDIDRTVSWLQKLFVQHGFKVELLTDPSCNPVVAARYDTGKDTTTLVYGHYDVQPASKEQDWDGDPFKLREADGRLYGRGVVDNKGQVLAHMVSVFERIKDGSLATNAVFLIEGNEETSNEALPGLIKANKKFLACDSAVVSDGEILGELPTIEASLRGGANMRVRLRTGVTDLHSGIAGGGVPNAAKTLTDLLVTLSDPSGKLRVPGFYDSMADVDLVVQSANARLAANLKPSSYGVKQFLIANNTDFYTQTGLYPTLQITGVAAGYTGEGFANIVPATAEARLNLRTVVGQDPRLVAGHVRQFLQDHCPAYAMLSFEVSGEHPAVSLDVTTPQAERARKLLRKVYGHEPVAKYVGGAIPIVADFQRLLGVDPLLISLGNDDCNMHGANENFRVDLAEKALAFSSAWFGE
jgi:acetylornithine deacetylase/succinyl-diaminopimelate desuccinylase-like protein